MLKNRHFVFMLSCLICMGVLLWSQSTILRVDAFNQGGGFTSLGDWGKAVTALAQGESSEIGAQPEVVLRNFWRQLDLRQIDSAKALLMQDLQDSPETQELCTLFSENPLISIQNITIVPTDNPQRYLVKMKWKSLISDRENKAYFCDVMNSEGKWFIMKFIKT